MTKRKLSLRRLFSNTKFLVIFSIFVAFIFWIVVALEYAPIVENVIKEVPVKIDIENSVPDKLGLQIFGQKEYTVDITVRGNRYVIGGNLVTADDFDVTAQTAYVNSSGNHTLQLKVTAKDANADYEIVSLSEEYIEVYFDKYEEKEYEVTPRIITNLDNLTNEGYLFYKDEIIAATPTVTLSGAQTEMEKIEAVYADVSVKNKLTESYTYDSKLTIDNGSHTEVKYVSINGESSLTVPITIPIYKVETLPTSVSFKNSPSDYINNPLSYTCNPSTVNVAVLRNGSEDIKNVEVGTIDFAKLTSSSNVFSFKASDLKDLKVLDSITNFKVTVNVEDIASAKMKIYKNSVSVSGADKGVSVNVDISSTGDISIAGSKSAVAAVTASSLQGKIDLKGVNLSSGSAKVPITVTLKDVTNCWVTGTYYANVTVKK